MKYIIDIEDEYTKDWVNDTPMCKELCMPISVPNRQRIYHVSTGFKLEPYTEPDRKAVDLQYARDIENVAKMNYNEGAKDAWEFARAINYMGYDDFVSCFGGKTEEMVYELSYSEVKAEYEAWKDKIRVGDEVVYADDPNKEKAIVLRLYQPNQYKTLADILCEDGIVIKMIRVENLAWTGRHFDEIADLLKKMKEGDRP